MGILSSFFDVVAGVSILAGRSSLLDTNLTTIAGRNFTVRGALGLSFLSVGFINLMATSRKQRKIERLSKEAETFNAENEIMVHQLISPYRTGGYATTYIYRDEKDLMNAIWHDYACETMETYAEEYPEYDWDGYIDSDENRAIFDKKTKDMSIDEILEYCALSYDLSYNKIPLNLEGFSVNGEYGEIRNLTRNSGILRAETFNAMSFKQWSNDEMNEELHGGQNMDFDAWLEDEVHTHGNIPLKEWGYEEEHDEPEHQHAESFSAEREVYVLTFSDPMRNGKLVELPFLTYGEAQEYIEAHIAPYNANKPFSQMIATRIIFPSEEYNAPAAVMRTYKGRKSPSISAKSVKVGTRKRGNDGKMWQVRSVRSRGKRTQRWFKD